MSAIMVSIECTCLAFLLVDLVAYFVLPHPKKIIKDNFIFCLVSLILGLIFDIGAWACECLPAPQWLQYASNTLCLMSSGFTTAFFAYYILSLIREQRSMPWLFARIVAIANLCGSAVVMVAAFCGELFDIVPYPEKPEIMIYYAKGLLYDVPNILSALSLLALFILILCNAKVLGKKKIIIFSIYFLVPLIASFFELLFENLQFSFALTCVNMGIVYVMLQSRRMDELLVREKLLNEWSYLDSLTGLLNRRAFDRDIEAASNDDLVNVAFFDLNGLKRINDEEGHYAGDQHIIKFSTMLTKYFSHDYVYRISGDEFVVVTRKISNDEFNNSVIGIKQEIIDNSYIAAFGTAIGKGSEAIDLVNQAEVKMYDDKKEFYKNNPNIKHR